VDTVMNLLPLAGLAAAFVAVFAIVTRRKPDNTAYKYAVGLALAAALAQALVGPATLIAGLEPRVRLIVLNGFFLALFAGSALLFRRAAPEVRRGRG